MGICSIPELLDQVSRKLSERLLVGSIAGQKGRSLKEKRKKKGKQTVGDTGARAEECRYCKDNKGKERELPYRALAAERE